MTDSEIFAAILAGREEPVIKYFLSALEAAGVSLNDDPERPWSFWAKEPTNPNNRHSTHQPKNQVIEFKRSDLWSAVRERTESRIAENAVDAQWQAYEQGRIDRAYLSAIVPGSDYELKESVPYAQACAAIAAQWAARRYGERIPVVR